MTARWAPGIEVIGGAATGVEAIELARSLQPDIVRVDPRIPGLDGVAATRELVNGTREGDCAARVLLLTTFDDDELVHRALCAGAMAICSSMLLRRNFIAAIGRAQPANHG